MREKDQTLIRIASMNEFRHGHVFLRQEFVVKDDDDCVVIGLFKRMFPTIGEYFALRKFAALPVENVTADTKGSNFFPLRCVPQ